MDEDTFSKKLREMYPVNSDYYIAFRSADDFVEYWRGEVLKKSDGEWDYDNADKVMTTVITSR
jgi:hypothetical protein